MARKRKRDADQLGLLEARVATAPCVPSIRGKVKEWREGGYKGVTDTTRILLNYWFYTDHRPRGGAKFAYHYFEREAVETLIYLYEIAKVQRHKTLVESFATRSDLRLLQYDDFPRYCVKMATGSGKTKAVSLAVAWQFFNAVVEARDDFARTFLLIAPNVIVFERLRTDFEGGRIFRVDPIIPPEMEIFWRDFQCYMRGEGERASSLGALYLTNVQQFYERQKGRDDEPDEMTAVLGRKPPAQASTIEDFDKRIVARGGPVVVLNDEAHHTHDEESEWNRTIRGLDAAVSGGLAAQLDFTATPRHSKGQLFSWTVFDYPLKQAIIDNVVKRPLKGIAQGITEQRSDVASTRYQAYLAAGVERWKEYREQLAPLGRKPVLPRKQDDAVAKKFRYEGYDIITLQKLVEREYSIPEPQTAEEVIGYYARRIAQDVKLPSQFSALAPKVREFLETKAFGERVTLSEPAMIKAISSNVAQYVTVKTFVEALRKLVIAELEPQLLHAGRFLSETPPFPWSRPTIAADKSIFNLVPCDNEFEKEFAQFLQKANDVDRFAKLPEQFGFAIEYVDTVGNLRYYEPDFVVLASDGTHNVANKDRAAQLWCENTTRLSSKPWAYLKVLQTAYKQLQPTRFEDLFVLEQKKLL
jgi:hypothetical protein